MRTLFFKDLLALKAAAVVAVLYGLMFFLGIRILPPGPDVPGSGFVYVLSGTIAGFMFLMGSFQADDDGSVRFWFALPVSRFEGVLEKYLLLFLGAAWGTFGAVLAGLVFSLPALGRVAQPITVADTARIVACTGFVSVLEPFYFRFGRSGSRYLLYGLFGILLLVQLGTVALLLISNGPGLGWFGGLLDRIFGYRPGGGTGNFPVRLLAGGLCCLGGSLLAALRIFRRRDL